jgi:ankyrin repeat protein
VRGQDEDGQTGLHLAADRGHMGVVEVLLEHKASVNIQVCV